ncbi:MAG: deoxyribose-phosphate aldolase [Bacteroidales bacterium]|nr:deoxyribose-phosphate aldolase [Bacteroidales bacterium]
MKYFNEFQYDTDPGTVQGLLSHIAEKNPRKADRDVLINILGLLDLTSLSETDNAENIGKMCYQLNLLPESYPELPAPAAICVYPELVPVVKAKLNNPLVNIASVGGGFPASQTFLEIKLKEIEMAMEAGADEIDIVMTVGKFRLGLYEEVFEEIRMIKEQMGSLHLKVILETCSHESLTEVRKASILAMDAGADFIKTSTGKSASGANPESFAVMCLAVKDFYEKTGKKIGIKPAGGISTVEDSLDYYNIVSHILGEAWLNDEKFRIGASRLANNLIRKIFKKEDSFSYFN